MNNLYEITGDIKDINTLLINRNQFEREAIYTPVVQNIIRAKSRLEIEILLIELLLEDPDREFTASDMEYWNQTHDKIYALAKNKDHRATRKD